MTRRVLVRGGALAILPLALVAVVWIAFNVVEPPRRFIDDNNTIAVTPPPEARNACERTFANQLITEWEPASVPSPTEAQLKAVLNACTSDQLLAADERFVIVIGHPGGYMSGRRLFNGADISDQFAALCRTELYATTTSCRGFGSP